MEITKTHTPERGLIITEQAKGKELSRLQKQFNQFMAEIAALEQEITHNRQMLQVERNLINGNLFPLYGELNLSKYETAQAMDKILDYPSRNRKLSSSQLEIMEEMIAVKCFELLEDGMTFEGLENLHDKYAPKDYQEIKQQALKAKLEAEAKRFEQMTGIKVKLTPALMDEEKFQEHLRMLLDKERGTPEVKTEKTKSAQKLEREAKQKAEEQKRGKSLRNVYTALVKVLHPDLEKDELEKNRKTEVMQRITAAYEKGDLPTLLALQLEHEQTDATKIGAMGDDELKRYVKLLKEQLSTLEKQAETIFESFRTIDNSHKTLKKVPEALIERYIKQDVQAIKSAIKAHKRELSALLTPSVLPQLIKEYKDMLKEHYR